MTWIQYVLLGLGMGSAYVLLAQGIVSIYRASGVVNFAHGGLAMAGAYLYHVEFRTTLGWSEVPSFIVAVLAVTLLAGLIHPLVMRPLRRSAALTQVIATLGILIVLQAIASLRWGTALVSAQPVLPSGSIHLGNDLVLPADRLWLTAIAVLVTAALYLYGQRALSGIAARAGAENQRSISALGWSPDRLSTTSWAAGGGLAAVAGILVTPYSGLNITVLTFIVIAALAAALVGDFSNYWLVLVGGLSIGIVRSLIAGPLEQYVPTGSEDAVPFFLILIMMIIRGRGIPMRGAVADRLPSLGSGRIRLGLAIPAAVVTLVLVMFVFSDDWNITIGVMAMVSIIMVSVVVLTGFTGQLSLAQYALAGFGGLFGARIAGGAWHLPFSVALVVGTIGAAVCGVILALPALRTRGVNLAVITLGMGLAVQSLIFNNNQLTGGTAGVRLDPPTVFGHNIDPILSPTDYTVFTLICLIVVMVLVANMRRGASGRRLIAVRTNERAASALGIDVVRAKIVGFAISSGIAGFGGVLWAYQYPNVVLGTGFQPMDSINAVGLTVAGGLGWVFGPALGSGLHPGGIGRVISEHVVAIESYIPLVGGVALLLILITHPDGQASVIAHGGKRIAKLWARGPKAGASDAAAADRERDERLGHVDPVEPETLSVRGLGVRYGGVVALDGVDLQIEPGSVIGLMGPNGAGKTTFIDAVTGFVRPVTGTIHIGGAEVTRRAAWRRSRLGMSRSFQSLELIDDITVRENLLAAAEEQNGRHYLTDMIWPRKPPFSAAAAAAVREFGLAEVLDRMPSEIPYGTRRLVAIARAVASSPSILLLDEPGAGLDETESAELGRLVRGLADRWGMSVLLVEHDVRMLMETCDRILVLDFGEPIFEGTPSEVAEEPAVLAAYLGRSEADVAADEQTDPEPSPTL
ncbi:ABC transporter permease subunit [Actinomadura rugatobispora]|uniref:ATP-binding cassette domain-containing protein n=1 Tax=Actinomadura rugatobispora TaxID=1994 RepID=A0ABW0ZQ01_9ACTN|nr:branched-chain amino acid ABC transporter permease/ATP-binding protein [Actinomadura rugatobispora]